MGDLKTLRNAVALVRLLERRPALSLTELAAELGVSVSATHRIASTLRSERVLRQDPRSRRYSLVEGVVLDQRGSELDRCLALAPAHLATLRDITHETVHVAVRTGLQVRFPAAVESSRQVRVSSSVGRTIPVHATATGKVLLSRVPDEEIRALLGGSLEPLTDRTLLTVDALLADLATVREQGYATNVSETDAGLFTVAVGVEGRGGEHLCALAVSAPLGRVRADPERRNAELEDGFVEALRLVSDKLAEEIRH